MPIVRVREGENPDYAIRRFKRAVEKAGTMAELRKREFHEKPTAIRKRQAAAARKRHLKRMRMLDPRSNKRGGRKQRR